MGTECKNDGNLEKCKAENRRNHNEIIYNIKCESIMWGILNWTAFKLKKTEMLLAKLFAFFFQLLDSN